MMSYSDCLLKFISAQTIQILEGFIVTHGGALSAFHELRGVDVLVRRLEVEVGKVKDAEPGGDADKETAMITGDCSPAKSRRRLCAAHRVLLFSDVRVNPQSERRKDGQKTEWIHKWSSFSKAS